MGVVKTGTGGVMTGSRRGCEGMWVWFRDGLDYGQNGRVCEPEVGGIKGGSK